MRTNQKTTRAGYGHPGLQSIDIQEIFRDRGGHCSNISVGQKRKQFILERPRARSGKGSVDLDHRIRPILGIWFLLKVSTAGHCDSLSITAHMDELPFPSSLRATLLLDHIERNRIHRLATTKCVGSVKLRWRANDSNA